MGDESMCLVAVYVRTPGKSESGELALADIAHIECRQGAVVLSDLLGQSKILRARLRTVDFLNNEVVLEKGPPDDAGR
jgi:predicted RNA-binding protein